MVIKLKICYNGLVVLIEAPQSNVKLYFNGRKAMSTITLTASMRSNLAALKTIQGQMDTTQGRLSTGKKVNSAIDNASSFYQSRALTNRASDLDSLLDSMGQGIQTIQAANEGIEAITSYIE